MDASKIAVTFTAAEIDQLLIILGKGAAEVTRLPMNLIESRKMQAIKIAQAAAAAAAEAPKEQVPVVPAVAEAVAARTSRSGKNGAKPA